jgi:transposase-like protein
MTKAEQARLLAWRHRTLQFAANGDRSVSRACRHFGIPWKTVYKWKVRDARRCGPL